MRELSYGELAAELEVPEPTVRARVSRGLRALGREMADEARDLVGDTA